MRRWVGGDEAQNGGREAGEGEGGRRWRLQKEVAYRLAGGGDGDSAQVAEFGAGLSLSICDNLINGPARPPTRGNSH